MAKTSAIITYTDANGKAMQKTLTDINPEATNTEIKTFAQKMVGMTDNVYVQTDRVDKINCDSEASPSTKQTPTLTVSSSALSCAGAAGTNFTYSYDGDGQLFTSVPVCTNDQNYADGLPTFSFDTSQPNTASVTTKGYQSGKTFQFLFGATETDNYKAPEPITMTLTIS